MKKKGTNELKCRKDDMIIDRTIVESSERAQMRTSICRNSNIVQQCACVGVRTHVRAGENEDEDDDDEDSDNS